MGKFLAFLGALAHALACESIYVPPCEVGDRSDQIFVGTAIGEQKAFGTFRFRIDEAFKGIAPSTREIEVGPGACKAGYQEGRQYLVLVQHQSGVRIVGYTLGELAEDAVQSIDFFRALARGEHPTVIKGRVAENVEDSSVRFNLDYEHVHGLPGVEMTASKDGRSYAISSDFSGSYFLRVPEAGEYDVVAKLAGHAAALSAYKLEVTPDSCKELNVGMWTASRLAGHVIGADGKPVEGIVVERMRALEKYSSPAQAKTDATGEFEFTNVPPEDYVLGVNIKGLTSKLPYDTRFYPGVPERSAAGVVKITGAQAIEGLDFQIGERKLTRRIEVTVEWPDGRPVINASVVCLSTRSVPAGSRRDLVSRYVNPSGQATCEVLADEPFEVYADRLSWSGSSRPIQPIKMRPKLTVPEGKDTAHLRFVIDLVNDISAREAPMNMSAYNDKEP